MADSKLVILLMVLIMDNVILALVLIWYIIELGEKKDGKKL